LLVQTLSSDPIELRQVRVDQHSLPANDDDSFGDSGGVEASTCGGLKAVAYVLILGIATYWGSKAQLLYFWDEILWVCGFLAIDGNLKAHRARLLARA
jgi:hypothetical protein